MSQTSEKGENTNNNTHCQSWKQYPCLILLESLWVAALLSYQPWIPSFLSAESEMGEPGEVIPIIHIAWGGNSSKLWNPLYQGHSIFIGRHPISMSIAGDKNNSWVSAWAGDKSGISHRVGVGLTHSLSNAFFGKIVIHTEIYFEGLFYLLLFFKSENYGWVMIPPNCLSQLWHSQRS